MNCRQSDFYLGCELMSARKPLVKFEKEGQAKIVSGSMPGKRKRTGTRQAKKTKGSGSNKPRVIKGRVNVKVSGYKGIQKVPPSQLIPFLPASKVRQAAKKALSATGQKQRVKRRRTTKKKKN